MGNADDPGSRAGAARRSARMLARADVRRTWRAAVGLGVIAALAGGAVLALALGARRTQTAYGRLVAAGNLPARTVRRIRTADALRSE